MSPQNMVDPYFFKNEIGNTVIVNSGRYSEKLVDFDLPALAEDVNERE